MMGRKTLLWKRAAVALLTGAAILLPLGAKADFLSGLSLRAGFFWPHKGAMRSILDTGAFGGGIEYKVPWIPTIANGQYWSTTISADFHYSERGGSVFRYIPVSINQVYTFEERNNQTPYLGFCITAATFGTSGTTPRQPTVTRVGGGIVAGLNFGGDWFIEGRYEWFDKHRALETPEGFRGYFGYRF
ncbi:MAG TPA: hypothetical protein VNJ09_01125 [Chthonomonadales bacterium]|nr:hypothetical protein [Chthonomonadales bacterium]